MAGKSQKSVSKASSHKSAKSVSKMRSAQSEPKEKSKKDKSKKDKSKKDKSKKDKSKKDKSKKDKSKKDKSKKDKSKKSLKDKSKKSQKSTSKMRSGKSVSKDRSGKDKSKKTASKMKSQKSKSKMKSAKSVSKNRSGKSKSKKTASKMKSQKSASKLKSAKSKSKLKSVKSKSKLKPVKSKSKLKSAKSMKSKKSEKKGSKSKASKMGGKSKKVKNGKSLKSKKGSKGKKKGKSSTPAGLKGKMKKMLNGKNRKWFMIGAAIAILFALLVLVLIVVLMGSGGKLKPILCDNPSCNRVSGILKGSYKLAVDPCTDFYDHVCGRYKGKSSLISERKKALHDAEIAPLNGKMSGPVLDKIKSVYSSCIQSVGSNLKDIASETRFYVHPNDFQGAVIYFLKLTSSAGIFDLQAHPYIDKKTNKTIVKLIIMPPAKLISLLSDEKKFRAGMRESIKKLFYSMYATGSLEDKLLDEQVASVMRMLRTFMRATNNAKLAVHSLEKPVDGLLDWRAIANGLSPQNPKLYDQLFAIKGFSQVLNSLFEQYKKEIDVLVDFMRFYWTEESTYYTPNKDKDSALMVCGKMARDLFPDALAYFYIQSKNDTMTATNNQHDVEEIAETIKSSFIDVIMDSSWIDEKTRKAAANKVKLIKLHVGFGNVTLQKKRIEKLYQSLVLTPRSNFLDTLQDVQKWKMTLVYDVVAGVKNDEFVFNSVDMDSKYSDSGNIIYFPMEIVTSLDFDSQLPFYFNYGGVGQALGHAMGHALGPKYYNLDPYGIETKWWSRSSEPKLLKNSKCLTNYYTKTFKVDGDLTLEENSADVISSRATYLAMQRVSAKKNQDIYLPGFEGKTNEQMFFYSHALAHCESDAYRAQVKDNHASGRARVNGPFAINKKFADAFECKEGTKMNPIKKCIYYGDQIDLN